MTRAPAPLITMRDLNTEDRVRALLFSLGREWDGVAERFALRPSDPGAYPKIGDYPFPGLLPALARVMVKRLPYRFWGAGFKAMQLCERVDAVFYRFALRTGLRRHAATVKRVQPARNGEAA